MIRRLLRLMISVGLMLFLLTSCSASEIPRTNLDALEQQHENRPKGPPFLQLSSLQNELLPFGSGAEAFIERYAIPASKTLLGHVEKGVCYALDAESQQIVRLNLANDDMETVVAVEEDQVIAPEIAFTEHYLLWLAMEPWQESSSGLRRRTCHLMLKDLAQGTDVVLDSGVLSHMDWPSQPFDYLNLEGNYLAYRASVFDGGRVRTRIQLVNIATGENQRLAEVHADEGREIVSCHLAQQQLVWDLRSVYPSHTAQGLTQMEAVYDIFHYQLDDTQLHAAESRLSQLTRNDSYCSPRIYHHQVLAAKLEGSDRHIDSQLVVLTPMLKSEATLADSHTPWVEDLALRYSFLKLERHRPLDNPLRIFSWRLPYVDSRYVSWLSNIADKHILYDMASNCFVGLPEETLGDDAHPPDMDMPSFWLKPLPSATSDSLLLGFTEELTPRYLLVLR